MAAPYGKWPGLAIRNSYCFNLPGYLAVRFRHAQADGSGIFKLARGVFLFSAL